MHLIKDIFKTQQRKFSNPFRPTPNRVSVDTMYQRHNCTNLINVKLHKSILK